MAEIAPFRGLRYNPEKVPDFAKVFIPPYDVISPKEQEAFHEASPLNMIRLELGKSTPEDSETNNPHTRAAAYLEQWRKERALIQDDQPSLYYYELDYALAPSLRQTRYGFLCALKLEEFSTGAVRPHEKTFPSIKAERLGLMRSCNANLSPVFALYSDPSMLIDEALRSDAGLAPPIISFKDGQGMEHRIWRIHAPGVLKRVAELMREKAIFIADGHHRYETALNYRALQSERFPQAGPNASFNYILVYLSNLNEGGLTILPTHRMIRNWGNVDVSRFLTVAGEFFEVESFEANEAGRSLWRESLEASQSGKQIAIGFHCQGAGAFHLLKARESVLSYLAGIDVPRVLRDLDVVVLDELILKHLLTLPETFLGNEKNIHFRHDFSGALVELQAGQFEAGFFINPTRIEQVQAVANAGLIMPHKSTYFYPKVGSGLVINLLSPEEEIVC